MQDILQQIKAANHIVVIAHINPDADSLGSSSALYSMALSLHKKVSFFCATKQIDHRLHFLPWFEKIRDTFPASADLAIALNCSRLERMGITTSCTLINIDHHKSNTHYGDVNFVDPKVLSTTTLVYDVLQASGVKINQKMALALYAGLIEETKCFAGIDSHGMVFALAKELISYGANHADVVKNILHSRSLGALRLKALMFEKMRFLFDARIVCFYLDCEDMKRTGARAVDAEFALEEALYLATVDVCMLIKEESQDSWKFSFRSNGTVNVSKIASLLGGEGDQLRSEADVTKEGSLELLEEKIVSLLKEEM